jgi:hypothetical protein
VSVLELYACHDPLTDPGELGGLYGDLPSSPSRLREVVSQLIAHVSWLPKYGVSLNSPVSRETQPIATRLKLIQAACPQSLLMPRPADRRSFGTCRDYALLLCSMLRHRSIAARVRCGFATYLTVGGYEDHWICEYWLSDERRWARADAQLDDLHRAHLEIGFDPADMPRGSFLTAAQAWRMVRSGVATADDFGHGGANGPWFLRVNVHRDLLALTNQRKSAWDTWRSSTASSKFLDPVAIAAVDLLTCAIEECEIDASQVERLKDLAAKSRVPPWRP